MTKIRALIAAVLVATAALVAGIVGDTSSAASRRAPGGTLVAIHKTAIGTVVVDARGHTLYLFDKDKNRMSSCNGACVAFWPPVVTAGKPRAGAGVRASLLGTTRRAGGRRQVTYAGHPLYTFVGDKKAGQTAGEGLTDFGATWDAIAPSGRSIEPSGSSRDVGGSGW